jgi:HK97 gp10 family phage protein
VASTGFSIQVKGAKELANALADGDLIDRILRPGFEIAAVIVKGSAKGTVHRVTGKLQGSLGSFIEGQGRSIEAHIGPQPGMSQSARYTTSDTSSWRRPRAGTNKGDPQVYAEYEEGGTRYRPGHPFLEPALSNNIDQIENVINDEAEHALRGLGRRR